MAIVAVLGAGRMGTAFCTPLLDRGHKVRLVGTHLDVAYIDALRANGVHPGLEHPIPSGASYHQLDDLPTALEGAEMLVIAVSSSGISWATRTLARLMAHAIPVILITKGFEWDGTRFRLLPDLFVDGMSDAVRHALYPVAVTGPCVAGELIRRRDTCVVFTGRDAATIRFWASAASTPYYHIWESTEFEGCEASAGLKNAYAIAIGFARGALERTGQEVCLSSEPQGVAAHNYEAAVFAESILEMARLVGLVGGDPSTPYGLVGVGDLLVTTFARSVRFGRLLGLGLSLGAALREMAGVTLEGVAMIRTIAEAVEVLDASALTRPDELPLMRHLVAVINGGPVRVPFDRFFEATPPDVVRAAGAARRIGQTRWPTANGSTLEGTARHERTDTDRV